MAESGATTAIKNAVGGFAETLPVLMKALDEIGKIHPVIQGSILAHELSGGLKNVKDEAVTAPDGVTIEARLQGLMKQTAGDIQSCGNVCDAYSKMSLLAKVLKGPLWEGTFASFVSKFSQRRDDIEFALSIHIAGKVDGLHEKVDDLAQIVERKTDMIIEFLKNYIPPEHKEVYEQIDRRGGREAVLKNDDALQSLVSAELETNSSRPSNQATALARNMKHELESQLIDPTFQIQKNNQSFDRKFEMQQRQILEGVGEIVHRESDRVIESVTSGPHDRILDKDLHQIWKDMGWRGSVKARHFVLALRDYEQERREEKLRKEATFQVAPTFDPDAWAFDWITVKRLQAITEALDDDASGFITVTEANNFTSSRPADWSLPHWLAYWAIGWQISATIYRDKIHEIFEKMFAIRPHLHEANVLMIDSYLSEIWAKLLERFQSYIDAEEERLKKNLEAIKYHVDDSTSLALVTGPGRIEKYLFPLIYLLLKHDYAVFCIGRKEIVNERHNIDASDSQWTINQAVCDRIDDMKASLKHQRLNLAHHFEHAYSKVYHLMYLAIEDPESPLPLKTIQTFPYKAVTYDDTKEDKDAPTAETVLFYAYDQSQLSAGAEAMEDIATDEDRKATGHLKNILGHWTGYHYTDTKYPFSVPFTVFFHTLNAESTQYEALVHAPDSQVEFKVAGDIVTEADGKVTYQFRFIIPVHGMTVDYDGTLNEDGSMLSGRWGPDGTRPASFFFSKMPEQVLICRPSPMELQTNRIRALWRFALTAVQEQVARRRFTWKFLAKRRDVRRRYVDLALRTHLGRPLNEAEDEERRKCLGLLSPLDALIAHHLMGLRKRTICIHKNIACDSCEDDDRDIIDGRIVCLTCGKDGGESVDLCEDCIDTEVDCTKRPDLAAPHLPTHDLYKLRSLVHHREFRQIASMARDALERARTAFKDAQDVAHEQTEEGGTGETEDHLTKIVQEDLTCVKCKERVTQPCWYCIVCEDAVFVCMKCDTGGGVSEGKHAKTHGLVRCQEEIVETEVPAEEKLESMVTNKFAKVDGRLDEMDTRLRQVDERLSRMELLLQAIALKMGAGQDGSS
ncbi:predicted protein [Postia placenta Mad-698-R]|uniref:Uncharacterized protein n=1 Tax=Postia placenta MAD-698-R-SB12 TaxID=670580 RepID=A0A1X6N5U0_9APHY|nr:hypothetical protein POSPLADRAFT_1179594 [Postia placenta MAD-698-R-SB12]EED77713.1 predicted protein [Postia placenta Mad-698-R]OSX63975.1 hypothetical protein POSPLADRAFT_1179594 [Postia placenta MAD-698-R-SB12]